MDIRGCRASLAHGNDEASIDYDNVCAQSAAEKAVVLDALLSASYGEGGIPGAVRSLRLGWLKKFSEDLSRRLAWAAYESAEWKALLAKRREMGPGDHGFVAAFISRLIERERLYLEIERTLGRHGAVVASAGVEKPYLAVPSATSSGDWLRARNVAADQLLPYDAFVVLELAPSPNGRLPSPLEVPPSQH